MATATRTNRRDAIEAMNSFNMMFDSVERKRLQAGARELLAGRAPAGFTRPAIPSRPVNRPSTPADVFGGVIAGMKGVRPKELMDPTESDPDDPFSSEALNRRNQQMVKNNLPLRDAGPSQQIEVNPDDEDALPVGASAVTPGKPSLSMGSMFEAEAGETYAADSDPVTGGMLAGLRASARR